jgi:signal recognition particle subunit SRP54
MFDSMTEKERLNPTLIDDKRVGRIAKGSGRKPQDVKELLQKFGMMQQVMGSIGQNPGLLGRIPGFKQMAQLQKMKGMDMGSIFGKDAKMMEQMMGGGMKQQLQMPEVAPGYTAPMGQAAMARARLMGYSTTPAGKPVSDQERDALKDKRKRERQNRKKNRKKNR